MTTDHGPGCARVAVEAAEAELIADQLWFHGATAVAERGVGRLVELEAGFPTPADAAAAAEAVGERGTTAEVVDVIPALEVALDAWMAFARPVRVGRLHVRPGWLADDDDPPAAGERVVVLDPSRAFGSGSHPSTFACLAAVDRLAGAGTSVLDVGCGSGVLAIAAAVLGARRVVAVDLDEVAVRAAAANAAGNGVAVACRVGSAGDVAGRFDVVLANIGAATVIDLAPTLAARTAPGGDLVAAGLHESRAEDVSAALAAAGLVPVERRIDDGWACFIHHSPRHSEHTVRRATLVAPDDPHPDDPKGAR